MAQTSLSAYDPGGNVYCTVSANVYAQGAPGTAYQCPTWQASWITNPPSPASLYTGNTPTTNQAKAVTTSFYDANGNLTQTSIPNSNSQSQTTTLTAYDADGRSYCTVSPLNYAAGTRCPTTPLTTPPATGSDPGYTTTIYDPAGRTLSSSDELGDTTTNTYAPSGDKLTSTSPNGDVTTRCYYWQNASSGPNSCASSAPSSGAPASALYSTTSPPTQADPAGLTTSYTYTVGGAPLSTTTPAGASTDSYYPDGTLESTIYSNTAPGYTAPPSVSYTYYPDGTRQTMTDGSGTTTTVLNAADQTLSTTFVPGVTGVADGMSPTVTSYGYFSSGDRQSVTYPATATTAAPTVNYTYDATGAGATLTDWLGGTTTFAHDQDGNVTSTAYPNATTVHSSYDTADAITVISATANASPATQVLTYAYFRNAAEQVGSETDTGTALAGSPTSGLNQTYSYTQAGQLASVNAGVVTGGQSPNAVNQAYYDPAGNPMVLAASSTTTSSAGATQTYNQAGELCWQDTIAPNPSQSNPGTGCATTAPTPTPATSGSAASTVSTYSYNSAGDRISSTSTTGSASGPTSPATTSYSYNSANQLVTYTPPTGTPAPANSATYLYNGDGLRVAKVLGTTGPGNTAQFSYDTTGSNSAPQVLQDGQNSYIYGPTGSVIEQIPLTSGTTGSQTYYVTDQLGSTRALLNSSGTVIATYSFNPLGTMMTETLTPGTTAPAVPPVGYAGGYTDSESGLIYLINRYYDPPTGTFLSVDPLVAQTSQPYFYGGDNTVNLTDPTGSSTRCNTACQVLSWESNTRTHTGNKWAPGISMCGITLDSFTASKEYYVENTDNGIDSVKYSPAWAKLNRLNGFSSALKKLNTKEERKQCSAAGGMSGIYCTVYPGGVLLRKVNVTVTTISNTTVTQSFFETRASGTLVEADLTGGGGSVDTGGDPVLSETGVEDLVNQFNDFLGTTADAFSDFGNIPGLPEGSFQVSLGYRKGRTS